MQYTSREAYEFISHQTNDPIVERKTCAVSGTQFPIYQSDLEFYGKISPTFAGNKFLIPTPTLCPEERQRRRLSFRNERKLYRRQCDASKKSIISIYSPDKPFKVYDQHIRWSDSRDPMDYGREFDFSKMFTENFRELMKVVPLNSLYIKNSENCSYNSVITDSKNCYWCTSTWYVENVMYSSLTGWLTNCMDSHRLLYSENCYWCIDCANCYGCSYLYACTQCTNCMFCIGLNNKTNCILNKQYSKSEYEQILKTLDYTEYYNKRLTLKEKQIQTNKNTESDNVYWSQIRSSKSSTFVFDVVDLENCKYMFIAWLKLKDSYDCSGWDVFQSSLCYECGMIPMNHQLLSCYSVRESKYLSYCFNCYSCSDCFWCIWLRNKQYCIFNKQYTKEEYEKEVAKIITHMQSTWERGEFFHPSLSPFWYNETVAQEYYPLTEQTAPASWFARCSYSADPTIPDWVPTIKRNDYSDTQRNELLQSDNLENLIFICSVSHRPFRLQKAEIEFYRKHHLPIPHKHPDIRHQERMKLRPWRTLYLRTCDCCGTKMLSVYPPDYDWKVYCEACYQKEVFG